MALKVKDRRNNHFAYLKENEISGSSLKGRNSQVTSASRKDYLPPVFTSQERMSPPIPKKISRTYDGPSSQGKGQPILVSCKKHPEELLKFIDISTHLMNSYCEMCIVDKDNDLRQMKLERINECHSRVKKLLKTQVDQLKELDGKIDSVKKNVKITNAQMYPILEKIDQMEKQTYYQMELLFKKIRQKFSKHNPFNNTKDEIEMKVDALNKKLEEFNYHDEGTLTCVRELLRDEKKIREENKKYVSGVNLRIELTKDLAAPDDRELGLFQAAFEEFMSSLMMCTERFAEMVVKQ